MKIQFNRQRMYLALHHAEAVVPRRHPQAVLKYAELEVTDHSASVFASDGHVHLSQELAGVEVEEPGKALLDVTRLRGLFDHVSDAAITLESTEAGVKLSGKSWEVEFETADLGPYPEGEEIELGDSHYVIAPDFFRELIRRTMFATSDYESSRYALGGVKLEFNNGQLTAVGTDGRRLAKMDGPVTAVGTPEELGELIVPTKATKLIEQLICNAELRFGRIKDSFIVKSPTFTVVAEALEGRYPRWRDVVKEHEGGCTKLPIVAGELLAAVRRAAVVLSVEQPGLEFEIGQGVCVMTGHTHSLGKSRATLPIQYDGEVLRTCLNAEFLTEYLASLHPECDIVVSFKDNKAAVQFRTDDGHEYILMPRAED